MNGTLTVTAPHDSDSPWLQILSTLAKPDAPCPEAPCSFLLDHLAKVVWTARAGGGTTFVGGSVEKISGFTPAEILAAPGSTWMDRIHPDDRRRVDEGFRAMASSMTPFESEFRWQRKDGAWIWLQTTTAARGGTEPRLLDGMVADITNEKLREDELRQLQKMEAVGQFTGGIAHDFNNLLAVILANDTMLLDALADDDPRRADAVGILDAANRAAALTHQLLAFSRRHAYNPEVVDLNAIVGRTERMLRRVLGEDIELSIRLAENLDGVQADAGQVEQVLLNLVLNARHAMPAGGTLSIETAHVEVGREYTAGQRSAIHGAFVMLAVSDTGCGMDAETRQRAFDPFFTTKPNGRGTGLGLSTCLGIVKQGGGHIDVDSEPGQGTVIKVFLPRVEPGKDAAPPAAPVPTECPVGHETILVAEDNDLVRGLICRALDGLGYHVLQASTGQEALAIASSDGSHIDLVLSDIVMPDLSGTEIATRVQSRSARTRALFMSGHIDHVLLRNGALQAGSHFIQKPFLPQALARKVREVLDA